MTLYWDAGAARQNGQVVGHISEIAPDRWHWHLGAVRGVHITKGYGWCRREDAARDALARAWSKWCEAFGLVAT
jgi:hypothetical protein